MGFSSYMRACGFQSGNANGHEGSEDGARFSVMEFFQDFPLCCKTADVIEACFRPAIGAEDSGRETLLMEKPWRPPLYRDTSLLAAPWDGVTESRIGSSSSPPPKTITPSVGVFARDGSNPSQQQQHRLSRPRPVITDAETAPLPLDFVPPKPPLSQPRSCESEATLQQTNVNDHDGSLSRTDSKSRSSSSSTNRTLKPMDVVCGRGAPTSTHPGNLAFKKAIKTHEMAYLCATRSEKPKIATKLLEAFRAEGVRFVKRERNGCAFVWLEIGAQRAYEKICQSLREGAPQLRRRMIATETKRTKHGRYLPRSNHRPPRGWHLQERQDFNTAVPNETMRTGCHASPTHSSFSADKTITMPGTNRMWEPNHPTMEWLRCDAYGNKEYHYDMGNYYNDVPYYVHLPPHLGGERLFGDRIE